jgi:tripartite-type tricarboxylate transporter receptor subunit TctC
MRHVPYKGAANAAIDLAGGQIQVMLSSYSTLAGLISGGKVKALAVTSKQPHPSFPEVPPLVGAVPGFTIEIWVGVFAPAGTPASLVERLNRDVNEISASRDLATLLELDGTVPVPMSPAAFAARVKQELSQWKQIATERKIVAE